MKTYSTAKFFFITVVAISFIFMLLNSFLTHYAINFSRNESLNYTKKINVYQSHYIDNIKLFLENKENIPLLETNLRIFKDSINCSNICIFDKNIKQKFSTNSKILKLDTENKNLFTKIYNNDVINTVEYFYINDKCYIGSFDSVFILNKKYIICTLFEILNPEKIKSYAILLFTVLLSSISALIIIVSNIFYTKLKLLDIIFKKYLTNDFIISKNEWDILKELSKSKVYEIQNLSYNILKTTQTVKTFIERFISTGGKLGSIEEFFKTIFDESPVGIIVLNTDYSVISCNKIGKKLLDKDFLTSFNKQDIEKIEFNNKVVKVNRTNIGEYDKQNIILILDDITKEIKLQREVDDVIEELKSSNEMLVNYAHLISHDIKNPLRTINIFSQKAFVEIDKNKKSEYTKLVKKSILRINDIITDSLNFSKLNNKDIELLDVNIIECINDSIEILSEQIDLNNVIISKEFLNELIIKANKGLVINMIQNIISNGIKFNSNEVKHIKISVLNRCLTIKDNGIGISIDYIDKIFETFYRADSTYEGTGLGLSIVKKIADKFNIDIKVESKIDVGTEFKLNF